MPISAFACGMSRGGHSTTWPWASSYRRRVVSSGKARYCSAVMCWPIGYMALINAFHDARAQSLKRLDIPSPVPRIWLARRAADGLVAFEETGDEGLAGECGEHYSADAAVGDFFVGIVGFDDLD